MKQLIIAGREFNSRLFLGTGKFNSNELMEQSLLASGTEMVTVAMKRIDMDNKEDDMLKHIIIRTSSCYPIHRVYEMRKRPYLPHKCTRSFRNELVEVRDSSRPALSASGFGRNIEGYRRIGKTGICHTSLLPGRSCIMQTIGRSRCGNCNAPRCTHRNKQRSANQRISENHH